MSHNGGGSRNCIQYTFSFREKERELNSPESRWTEEEETMVRALPIIVAPVHRIVCVTLLYVTMIFDHELVKVTLLSLYQLRLITHLSSVICRRGEIINESFRCLDQSLCIFTHTSHDSEHVPSLYAGGGVTRVWAAYSWYQMLEWAALQLQSHSHVDTERASRRGICWPADTSPMDDGMIFYQPMK